MASVRLNGDTSGFIEISAPNVAGSTTITLPATSGGNFLVTDSNGDLNVDSGTLFVDASENRVGIGTSSPAALCHINQTSGTTLYRASVASNSTIGLEIVKTGATTQSWRIADGQTVNGKLEFYDVTDSATRMCIDGAGSVGIGTTNPGNYDASGDDLVVFSSGETGITIVSSTSSNGNIYFADGTSGNEQYRGWITYSHNTDYLRFGTAGAEKLRVRDDGDTAVYTTRTDGTCFQADSSAAANTTAITFAGKHSSTGVHAGTLSFKVTSNGNVTNTNNSYGSLSDIKLKENIVDAGSQWDDLKAIQVRNYNFKEETGHQTHTQLGVIAQEIELVSPGLVTETPDRDDDNNDLGTVTKSVNYSVLYMKAVKALQEAMERIETLETTNASLEARLTALEGGN